MADIETKGNGQIPSLAEDMKILDEANRIHRGTLLRVTEVTAPFLTNLLDIKNYAKRELKDPEIISKISPLLEYVYMEAQNIIFTQRKLYDQVNCLLPDGSGNDLIKFPESTPPSQQEPSLNSQD